jgi:hypothetical protein
MRMIERLASMRRDAVEWNLYTAPLRALERLAQPLRMRSTPTARAVTRSSTPTHVITKI